MALVFKGVTGEIRVGGRQAATLGAWQYAAGGDGSGGTLTASGTVVDEYWLGRATSSPVADVRLHLKVRTRQGIEDRTLRLRNAVIDSAGQGEWSLRTATKHEVEAG